MDFFSAPISINHRNKINIKTVMWHTSCKALDQSAFYVVNYNGKSKKDKGTSSGTQLNGKSIKTKKGLLGELKLTALVRTAAVIRRGCKETGQEIRGTYITLK